MVVTGLGIVTAYGIGWAANAAGFRSGERRFREVQGFDVSRQRVKTAAEIDLPEQLPETGLSGKQIRRMDRAAKLLLLAAREAIGQADWQPKTNTALVLGTTSGGMAMGEDYFCSAVAEPTRMRGQASRVTYYLAQRQAMDLVQGCQISGPIQIIANACAAGANAIGHAYELVRGGRCERAVAGGYDALCQLVFSGFDSLQALSPTTCRPFDAGRDGLALGEGAAVLTLESLASAEARGAKVLAEIVGYGASTDSHHLTQPHPEGEAAFRSMSEACAAAGVSPGQIGYVNAHGTGTPLNDSSEAAAINRWAGEAAPEIRVSSTKAGIGHLLGAAGAVEGAICVLSLKEQWLPPMQTTREVDPAVRFQLVKAPAEAGELGLNYEYALTNSFGFGGANASLIFRRWR